MITPVNIRDIEDSIARSDEERDTLTRFRDVNCGGSGEIVRSESGTWLLIGAEYEGQLCDLEMKPGGTAEIKKSYRTMGRSRGRTKPLVAANDNIGVELLSFSEFKARDGATADALIQGLVRTGTLIAIGGRPGAGKTALMVAIADALDAASPFLGRKTKPATVAYYAAEDGADIANRLEAIGNERIKIVRSPDGLPLTKPDRAAAIARSIIRKAKEIDPSRYVLLVVDTLRAALGGQSVLDDKYTSPALNALREVAESEGAVIAVLNHTNRENNKATKGETLESVVALELVLLEGTEGWFVIYVGKNRSGPGHRNIGRVRYTSSEIGDVSAAIVDELVADETAADTPKERGPSDNARMLRDIISTAILDSKDYLQPFGNDGPRVKAAQISDIRGRFYARKEGLEDTKKKAFTRALNYWLDRTWIVRGSFGAEGAVWLAGKERPEQSQKGQDTTPTKHMSLSVPH